MKRLCIFFNAILLAGICSVAAQDLIVMKDGRNIEAQITGISSTEIKYKLFVNLDGPIIVISADQVLSIRYENGMSEIITTVPAMDIPVQKNNQQNKTRTKWERDTAMDPDKFIFGVNVNVGGLIPFSTGPSVNFEFGKGKFNSEINIILPGVYAGGFGGLFMFNYFGHSRIGGVYVGGGAGYQFDMWWGTNSILIGLNAGYKFVKSSGLYFRTGAFISYNICYGNSPVNRIPTPVYIKPDLAIGWTMR